MTWGWSAKANDARTSPVPLLFIPKPNINATVSFRLVWKTCASQYPDRNAATHRLMTMTRIKAYRAVGGKLMQIFGVVARGQKTDRVECQRGQHRTQYGRQQHQAEAQREVSAGILRPCGRSPGNRH